MHPLADGEGQAVSRREVLRGAIGDVEILPRMLGVASVGEGHREEQQEHLPAGTAGGHGGIKVGGPRGFSAEDGSGNQHGDKLPSGGKSQGGGQKKTAAEGRPAFPRQQKLPDPPPHAQKIYPRTSNCSSSAPATSGIPESMAAWIPCWWKCAGPARGASQTGGERAGEGSDEASVAGRAERG